MPSISQAVGFYAWCRWRCEHEKDLEWSRVFTQWYTLMAQYHTTDEHAINHVCPL
jgi:hypothetical protein